MMKKEFDSLKHIALPVCVVDEFARIVYWNRHMADLFDLPADSAVGREWHNVVHTERIPGCCALCETRRSLRNGDSAYPVDVALTVGCCMRQATMVPLPLDVDVNGGASIGFLLITTEPRAVDTAKRPIPIHSRVRQLEDDRMIAELTAREREILDCVVNGLDARSIAEHLGITHATARNYVQRILNKLGVRNKAEAVNVALTYNLLAS